LFQHRAAGPLDRVAARPGRDRPGAGDRPLRHPPGGAARPVAVGHGAAGRRREPGGRGRAGQGPGHHLRAGDTVRRRGRAGRGPGRRYRRRAVAHLRLREPGVSHLLAAGRHARDPARHDRPRPGPALRGGSMTAMYSEAFEDLLEGQCGPAVVRAIDAGGAHDALWREIGQSGFLELMAPEDAGGAGADLADALPLFMALGAHAVPLPVGQAMALRTLLPAGMAAPDGLPTFAPSLAETADGGLAAARAAYGARAGP